MATPASQDSQEAPFGKTVSKHKVHLSLALALLSLVTQKTLKLETKGTSKDTVKLLGSVSSHEILQPEDSEANRPDPCTWQDPFRMSVLDFQHRALDKLAEILKLFLAKEKLSLEKQEDVQVLLQRIKSNSQCFANKLKYNEDELREVCQTLLDARNSFAHQKYVKGEITPKTCDPDTLQRGTAKHKKEFKYVYKSTRTFEKTGVIVEKCIEFTERVVECLSQSPMNEQVRCIHL